MAKFKLMGLNNIVAFSHSGNHIAVAGYDGTVKILDTSTGKAVWRHRIPGLKREVIIHHHRWSKDDRFYAFSCCSKVFVVDVGKCSLVRAIPVSNEERQLTVPMAFNSDGRAVITADTGRVSRHHIETGEDELIFQLPNGGLSYALDTNGDGDIAYKSYESSWWDKLLIWSGRERSLHEILLPYEYVAGAQMFHAIPRLTGGRTVMVLRKSLGLSWFSLDSLKETSRLTWEQLGFCTRHSFNRSTISPDGKYLLVNAETPDSTLARLSPWAVRQEDMRWVIYSTSERKMVQAFANGEGGAGIHAPTRRIALLSREWVARKRFEHVRIERW